MRKILRRMVVNPAVKTTDNLLSHDELAQCSRLKHSELIFIEGTYEGSATFYAYLNASIANMKSIGPHFKLVIC